MEAKLRQQSVMKNIIERKMMNEKTYFWVDVDPVVEHFFPDNIIELVFFGYLDNFLHPNLFKLSIT